MSERRVYAQAYEANHRVNRQPLGNRFGAHRNATTLDIDDQRFKLPVESPTMISHIPNLYSKRRHIHDQAQYPRKRFRRHSTSCDHRSMNGKLKGNSKLLTNLLSSAREFQLDVQNLRASNLLSWYRSRSGFTTSQPPTFDDWFEIEFRGRLDISSRFNELQTP